MKKKLLLMIGIVALAVSLAGIVVYQLFQPHYEPVTEVEYPGSLINISIPSTTPDQSLEPAPYPALGLFPEHGAKNVPLITHISVSYPRPPQFLKLEVEPEVEISHVKKELIFYSGKYTFYLAKPLQPGTNYTVTVIAGQKKPPAPDVAPTATTTWQFTTISKRMIGKFFVVLIIVFSAVFIGMRYKRRKDVVRK
ncbi:MAG TPA: Ig-like domain-containing protein [Thermoplasmata archaeon]|nr:Ig-like domain-containing protein [Thermoplasmata archaeon]